MAGRCPVGQITSLYAAGADISERPFSGWQTTIGYRWLRSDRHFTGTKESPERQEQGSQVTNVMETVDFGLTYAFNPRFSLSLSVPYIDNQRSQRGPNNTFGIPRQRQHTQARGIGDIRLSANYWLWDPAGNSGTAAPAAEHTGKGPAPVAAASSGRRGNIRLSVGIDMPTGEKDAQDEFLRFDVPTRTYIYDVVRTVDQSIQPGDGGWGIPIDLYAYYGVTNRLTAYLQGSYLITPERNNGVHTGRGDFEEIMSIGDTFMARTGFEYALFPQHGISVSLGLRTEGQPVYDLIGSSKDFRRPGMNIAVEPGITWTKKGWSASLSVPITFYRERFQSVPDKLETALPDHTGDPEHGDAAFADFYVMFSIGKQF